MSQLGAAPIDGHCENGGEATFAAVALPGMIKSNSAAPAVLPRKARRDHLIEVPTRSSPFRSAPNSSTAYTLQAGYCSSGPHDHLWYLPKLGLGACLAPARC